MRYVLIKKASELTGYSIQAIESKIAKAQWLEGAHYVKAPDGRVFIDLQGVERWIMKGSGLEVIQSRSTLGIKANGIGRL